MAYTSCTVLVGLQQEMDRLELQHVLWLEILGGRHYLAPLDRIKLTHALDVGTGTGSMFPTIAV